MADPTGFADELDPVQAAEMASIMARRRAGEVRQQRFAGGYLGYQGGKTVENADAQLKELAARHAANQNAGIQAYIAKRFGTPGVPAPADELGGGPAMPAAPADPQRALVDAVLSRDPRLQALARTETGTHVLPEGSSLVRNNGAPLAVNPKVAEHEIPTDWQKFLPAGAERQLNDPPGVFRMKGTDGQLDVYSTEFERGKAKGYKRLDASQIIRDPGQGNQTQTIQDPLDPTKTLVVKVGVFNEEKYKAGDKTGVVGTGPKASTEGVGRAEGFASYQSVTANLDKLEKQVQLTLDSKLNRATGLLGALPNVPGMAGADSAGRLDALKSQIGFEALQALRNAAHNGASGLGQVTEKEHVYLQTQLGNLQKAQSEAEVRRVLGDIKTWIAGARTRYKQAYETRYNAGQSPAPVTPPGGSAAVDALLEKYK